MILNKEENDTLLKYAVAEKLTVSLEIQEQEIGVLSAADVRPAELCDIWSNWVDQDRFEIGYSTELGEIFYEMAYSGELGPLSKDDSQAA